MVHSSDKWTKITPMIPLLKFAAFIIAVSYVLSVELVTAFVWHPMTLLALRIEELIP